MKVWKVVLTAYVAAESREQAISEYIELLGCGSDYYIKRLDRRTAMEVQDAHTQDT